MWACVCVCARAHACVCERVLVCPCACVRVCACEGSHKVPGSTSPRATCCSTPMSSAFRNIPGYRVGLSRTYMSVCVRAKTCSNCEVQPTTLLHRLCVVRAHVCCDIVCTCCSCVPRTESIPQRRFVFTLLGTKGSVLLSEPLPAPGVATLLLPVGDSLCVCARKRMCSKKKIQEGSSVSVYASRSPDIGMD